MTEKYSTAMCWWLTEAQAAPRKPGAASDFRRGEQKVWALFQKIGVWALFRGKLFRNEEALFALGAPDTPRSEWRRQRVHFNPKRRTCELHLWRTPPSHQWNPMDIPQIIHPKIRVEETKSTFHFNSDKAHEPYLLWLTHRNSINGIFIISPNLMLYVNTMRYLYMSLQRFIEIKLIPHSLQSPVPPLNWTFPDFLRKSFIKKNLFIVNKKRVILTFHQIKPFHILSTALSHQLPLNWTSPVFIELSFIKNFHPAWEVIKI